MRPCVSDLVELLRHVSNYSRLLKAEASTEQHITPHVSIRMYHAFDRLTCRSKQETDICLEEVKFQLKSKTSVVELSTSFSNP
jgi:hypothetical protein